MEHNVRTLQVDAFFSAQHKVLWHSYSEIQVLFKLDFIQTAIIRKEEIIQLLYEKGELTTEVRFLPFLPELPDFLCMYGSFVFHLCVLWIHVMCMFDALECSVCSVTVVIV